MNKPQDRTVSRRDDGSWANKRDDAARASSLHQTQKEAEAAAKAMLMKQGGGEVKVQGLNGKIRSKRHSATGGAIPIHRAIKSINATSWLVGI